MSSRVTVVIPNYNHARFLPESIGSAREADEIIVSDDGSTDDSVEVARSLGVTVLVNPHGGPVDAINAALDIVHSGWIVTLSADDILMPGAVAAIREKDCDILVPQIGVMEDGVFFTLWTYYDRTLTPEWLTGFARVNKANPVPTLIYHSDFLKKHGLRWVGWEGARHSEDCRTMLEWLKHSPKMEYLDYMTHGLRQHTDRETHDTDARDAYVAALDAYFEGEA